MGEIIYKKQFHREPIDETEPEVANFTDSGQCSISSIVTSFVGMCGWQVRVGVKASLLHHNCLFIRHK